MYQAKTLIYGIKHNATLSNMAFPHILQKCYMPNPAHPAKMSHVKSPNTLPKCHMPKLQHHAKMSQNKAAGLEQIVPASRFFLFTEVSRFLNHYNRKVPAHIHNQNRGVPKKLARPLQYIKVNKNKKDVS
jgi:hypothetical protein